VDRLTADMIKYLKEGVLQDDFVLDNIPRLMGLMREANVTLRWMMLHCSVLPPGKIM
jgi:WASH complex subunit strumpellin